MRLVSSVKLEPSDSSRRLIARSATRGELAFGADEEKTFFQSEHERNLLAILRNTPSVTKATWEPFTLRYFDHLRQKSCTYTPDYLIELETNEGTRQLLVEIKTKRDYNRTAREFAARYRAAERWAEMQPATSFKVITDKWMHAVGLRNYQQIDAVRTRNIPAAHLDTVRQAIVNHTLLSVSQIIALAVNEGMERAQIMPALWKLVSLGELTFDLSWPLDLETEIHAGKTRSPFE